MASRMKVGCPYCLMDYHEPRRLQCGDCLCARCLFAHIRSTVDNGQFKCPKCDQECPAPARIRLDEEFRQLFPLATSFIPPPEEDADVPVCIKPGHSNQELNRYCKTHKKFLCVACERSHRGGCTVNDVAAEAKEIKDVLDALSDKIDKYSASIDKETTSSPDTYKADIQAMENAVKSAAHNLRKNIDDQKRKLLAELSRIRKNVSSKIDGNGAQKNTKEALKEMKSMVKQIRKESNPHEVVEMGHSLQECLEELSDTPREVFMWKHSINNVKKSRGHLIGEITVEEVTSQGEETGTTSTTAH